MPEEDVDDIIKKYKQKLEMELGEKSKSGYSGSEDSFSYNRKIRSIEYQKFRSEIIPSHFSKYEKLCNLAEKIIKVKPDKKKEAEYKNISIDIDLDKNMPRIVTDRGKLQQILLNLTTNAFHAMDEGGHLEIKGTAGTKTQTISIKIKDDGCGISPENLKHIFDPFFTTKSKTGGTGLGLAICHGLIHDIKSSIDVESTVGVGTTFTITLPVKL